MKRIFAIVAEKSDHMIPWRQPDLIVEAVTKVIQASSSLNR